MSWSIVRSNNIRGLIKSCTAKNRLPSASAIAKCLKLNDYTGINTHTQCKLFSSSSMSMQTETLVSVSNQNVSDDGVVKTITMKSPKTRNSLSLEMIENLIEHIHDQSSDGLLRCIVIKGEGPAFSAGHNLKEMTTKEGKEYHEKIFERCNVLMNAIMGCPIPVIAVVNGVAAAAGCQLVAMCDIAIATKSSSFSVPGSSVGLFCSTPGIPLARVVPRKMSAYMLLTGIPISAPEALQSGLISKMLSSEEELDGELQHICNAIVSKPKAVIALGKRFYYRQIELGIKQALDEGGKVMVDNLGYKDAQEGIAAFKEKRKPVWIHSDEKV